MFRGALATVVPCGARGVHAAWRVALRCRPRAPLSRRDPGRRRPPREAAACGRDALPRPAPAGRGVSWKRGNRVEGLFRRPVPRALLSPAGRGTVASGLGTFPGSTAPCGRVRLPARPVLTREPEFQKYTRESRLFPRRCGVVRVGGEAAPWSPARPPWAPGRVWRGSPGAALGPRRVRLDDRPCGARRMPPRRTRPGLHARPTQPAVRAWRFPARPRVEFPRHLPGAGGPGAEKQLP